MGHDEMVVLLEETMLVRILEQLFDAIYLVFFQTGVEEWLDRGWARGRFNAWKKQGSFDDSDINGGWINSQ